jgi:hypothetical protein
LSLKPLSQRCHGIYIAHNILITFFLNWSDGYDG